MNHRGRAKTRPLAATYAASHTKPLTTQKAAHTLRWKVKHKTTVDVKTNCITNLSSSLHISTAIYLSNIQALGSLILILDVSKQTPMFNIKKIHPLLLQTPDILRQIHLPQQIDVSKQIKTLYYHHNKFFIESSHHVYKINNVYCE